MTTYEIPMTGHATTGPKFEAAASKLPPGARAKIRAALDSPRARAQARFRARLEEERARQDAKLARLPADMAKARAYATVQGEEREEIENSLRITLGKSHGLLARLNTHRRG